MSPSECEPAPSNNVDNEKNLLYIIGLYVLMILTCQSDLSEFKKYRFLMALLYGEE